MFSTWYWTSRIEGKTDNVFISFSRQSILHKGYHYVLKIQSTVHAKRQKCHSSRVIIGATT